MGHHRHPPPARPLGWANSAPPSKQQASSSKPCPALREIDDEILAYIENYGTDEDSYEPDYYQEAKDQRMYERMYPEPDLPAEAYE